MDVLEHTKKKMNTALEHLKGELKSLRTGRANASILDHVMVDAYGAHMRLQELASVSVPDSKQLLVTPFDGTTLHAIAKGIEAANLNLRTIVDGNVIRLKIPEMDASVRQEMVKQAKKKCEEAKVGIRNVRREGNEIVKKQKADGDIPEDVVKKLEKHIQELTDKSCKLADEITEQKEKEILTV
jgi:ribosome recycling factor